MTTPKALTDEKEFKKHVKMTAKLGSRLTPSIVESIRREAKQQTALAIFDFFDKEKRDAMEYDSEFFAVRIKEYNNLKKKFLGKAQIAKLEGKKNG